MIGRSASILAAATTAAALFALVLRTDLSITNFAADGKGTGAALWDLARYFTIWTNIGVLAVMALAAIAPARWGDPRAMLVAVSSITIVGSVYFLLLRGNMATNTPMENVATLALHAVVPVLSIATFVALRHGALAWRHVWWGMAPAAIYGTYVLVRGLGENSYPYWFLNYDELGLALFVRNSVLLTLTFGAVNALFIALDKVLARLTR
ncbi:Pr6Pr family membrane protein [Acuticoccus sp. MNP-M23]|uniref:Pr6Pr family membrane protein n=1 Tax=Acuticoccus sp. MNP-M23 TaxID=3072793 RepID=UPI002815A32A|nr:Pr6Pr family membrane protein [Acuticoccus sp. MNP-M23]WMS44176.1 Pr6Pr family membrane protein [Acuticoccus sp. MNP-M23]